MTRTEKSCSTSLTSGNRKERKKTVPDHPGTIFYDIMNNMKYRAQVKFGKKFFRIENDMITIGLTERPEKGKANEALIRRIAEHFNTSPARVRIVLGKTSRKKLIEIL